MKRIRSSAYKTEEASPLYPLALSCCPALERNPATQHARPSLAPARTASSRRAMHNPRSKAGRPFQSLTADFEMFNTRQRVANDKGLNAEERTQNIDAAIRRCMRQEMLLKRMSRNYKTITSVSPLSVFGVPGHDVKHQMVLTKLS